MINGALLGGRTVEAVAAFPTSTPNQFPGVAFRPAVSVRDGVARRYLAFVNDGNPATLPAPNIALSMNLSAWRLPAGTMSEPPLSASLIVPHRALLLSQPLLSQEL